MLPYKIIQDLNPASAPENSSNLNVNINFDILKQALVNEQGFDKLTTTGKQIIGSCILPDNSVCIFSVIQETGYTESEIGILTDTTYKTVLRDYHGVAELGFTTEHQIQAEAKVNYNGDYIIYWVDGFNSDKWLNLTNPQIKLAFNTGFFRLVNTTALTLMSGFTPTKGEYIDQTSTVTIGGSLPAAVYYIICTYGDEYKNFTKTLYISSPIPVTKSNLPFNSDYFGSVSGTVTNKAIEISIDSSKLNQDFKYIKVQVIKKENQILTGWNIGEYIFTTSDFICIINSLENEVTIDSIIINLVDYKSSLTLTQLDDVLYKAHLKSETEFDFQPYVNNTIINYIQKPIDLGLSTEGNNYKDPNMCFYSKGFMYDEVYALYLSFVIDDNGYEYETKTYHIPGRKATLINLGGVNDLDERTKINQLYLNPLDYSADYYVDGTLSDCTPLGQMRRVSEDACVYHGVATADNSNAVSSYNSNMGFYQNENETYADRNSWLVLDADGVQISTNKGAKIRHHKFPEAYVEAALPGKESIHPDGANYNIVNVLGVELSNVVIPTAYIGKVKEIKLYYAKRDYNNRTVLGQSMLETLNQFHVQTVAFGTNDQIINSVGNMLHVQLPAGTSVGMYPLGYEQTTALAASIWGDPDNAGIIRPVDEISGFWKLKAFDVMSQSLSPNVVSYIKNLYRIPSKYNGVLFDTDLSLRNRNFNVNYIFDPVANGYFAGINRDIRAGVSPFANQYRKLANIEYINMNIPTVAGQGTSGVGNFSMNIYNYGGEKAIWAQTEKRLFCENLATGTVFSTVNCDWATQTYLTNADWDTTLANILYASPYISNMCVFKNNMFVSFDNQILCEASVIPYVNDVTLYESYGGDTFINYYSERNTFDTGTYSPNTGAGDEAGFINTINNYICQSTSNIDYRYKGENSWETFYPASDWETIRKLPFSNPEWFGNNLDYASVNDIRQPVIASNGITQIQTIFPNRVIRSGVDNPETLNDNYLSFQAGDYKDFGKIKGEIQNITNQNGKLLIKTQNALYYTLGEEVLKTDNADAFVGSGDIFAIKPKETVTSDSYGGGIGRFTDVVTQYGYMYADAINGIVYLSNGQNIDEISKEGLQIFFRNELKFKLNKQLYDKYFSILPVYNATAVSYVAEWYVSYNNEIWKSNIAFISSSTTYPGNSDNWDKVDFYTLIDNTSDTQGIGTQATFDYKYRRYILHKKDYNFVEFDTDFLDNIPLTFSETNYDKIIYYNGILYKLVASRTTSSIALIRGYTGLKIDFAEYFEDKSFTIAYYPESKAWVSLYSYYPDFIFNTIDKVYSNKNSDIFKHNSETQNNFYYDDTIIESFVEPILNTPIGTKKFSSISFYTDVFVKTITTKALQYLDTFTSFFVRNTWQMSKSIDLINGSTSRNSERYFLTNDFRDFTRNNSDPLMNTNYISEQNTSNLNLTKHWSIQKKFTDYFLIPRLKFKQEWNSVVLVFPNVIDFNISANALTLQSVSYSFNIGDSIKFTYLSVEYIIQVTSILTGNVYNFISFNGETPIDSSQITEFEVLANKEIHIYDINSQSTKNIR